MIGEIGEAWKLMETGLGMKVEKIGGVFKMWTRKVNW